MITNQLTHRMKRGGGIECRVCLRKPHITGHILQTCPRTHGPRVQKHKIMEFVRNNLKNKGYDVMLVPRIRSDEGLLKPDYTG